MHTRTDETRETGVRLNRNAAIRAMIRAADPVASSAEQSLTR